ncbi:MAG: small subunit ribosomal protein S1 [Candidatus Paceibacteria bacterium]|jgi:small subunit ribosomal protein S1
MSSDNNPLDAEIEAALNGMNLQDISGRTPESTDPKKSTAKQLKRGTVVGVTGPDVFVELGPREQGVISVSEFETTPSVGDCFDFTVGRMEEGLFSLSMREAKALAAWNDIEMGSMVSARVTGVNTGGLELKIGPLAAFMPASHVALSRVEDLSKFLNETMLCQVIEVVREKQRVVISRRAILEGERDQARSEAADSLVVGSVVRGKVTRIEKFGAFIQIAPGLEGLAHVSQLSQKRVENVEDFLKPGQDVECLVLEIKDGGQRISLSMKALEPNPWDEARDRYHEGTIIEGKVVRVADFGCFVELEAGIDGLVHISQLSRDRINRVRDEVKEGETFPVRVISVDVSSQRISLSRLDESGSVLGSEEAADAGAVRDMMQENRAGNISTNLGDLFKKAMDGGK